MQRKFKSKVNSNVNLKVKTTRKKTYHESRKSVKLAIKS
jgi:hypothetical protein